MLFPCRAEEMPDDGGLPLGVGVAVVAALCTELLLDGLVARSCLWALTKQVPEPEIVLPLRPLVFDEVQVGNAMPGACLEDEHMPSGVAGVASVDPARSLERRPRRCKIVFGAKSSGEIGDRLGQETFDGR